MPFIGGRGSVSRGFFGAGGISQAPTSLSSIEGNGQLTISFTPPAFSGGLLITNYEYALSTDGGSTYGAWAALSPSDTTSPVTIGGLANGTLYHVKLRAVTSLGGGQESSVLSTNTTPFTIASSPTITALTPGDGSITVNYSAPASNGGRPITGYSLQYSSDNGSTWSSEIDSGNDLSETVTGLTNGSSYIFRAWARTAAGAGQISSNSSSETPRTVPSAVATPSSSSGDRRFSITWTPPNNGGSTILGYRVQYSADNGSTWSSALDVGNINTYQWTLANGIAYVGRVLAYNIAGNGSYSGASTAKTPSFAAPAFSTATYQTPIYIEANGYDDTTTWYVRPFRVTFTPTVCENYQKTVVTVSKNDAFYLDRVFETTSTAANQTFDINHFDDIFGGVTTIGFNTSYTVTVATFNTDPYSASSSASWSVSSSSAIPIARDSTNTYTTDQILVTGGSMARTYYDWYALSSESVTSARAYARITTTSSNTVSSSRNPSLGLSGKNSSTGITGGSTTMLALNGGSAWATGGSWRSQNWDHTDLNTAFDSTINNGQRYSVIGGGTLTGTWSTGEQINTYLVIMYVARSYLSI